MPPGSLHGTRKYLPIYTVPENRGPFFEVAEAVDRPTDRDSTHTQADDGCKYPAARVSQRQLYNRLFAENLAGLGLL